MKIYPGKFIQKALCQLFWLLFW